MGWPNLDPEKKPAARRHRFQSGLLLEEGSNEYFRHCPIQALGSETWCGCGLGRVRGDCDSGLLTTSACDPGNQRSGLCDPTLLPSLG
jgi:hypothetical protein